MHSKTLDLCLETQQEQESTCSCSRCPERSSGTDLGSGAYATHFENLVLFPDYTAAIVSVSANDGIGSPVMIEYSTSGSMSAPLGQQMVPTSELTSTFEK